MHIVIRSVTSCPSSERHGPNEGVETCQTDTENISVRPSVRAGESAENKFRFRPNGRCTACVHHPQQQQITDGMAAVEGGENFPNGRRGIEKRRNRRKPFRDLKRKMESSKRCRVPVENHLRSSALHCDVTDGTKWPNPPQRHFNDFKL